MRDLLSLLPEEVDELIARHGQPRYRGDQLLAGLYKKATTSVEELRQLPRSLISALRSEDWRVAGATEESRVESSDRTTVKALLAMDESTQIETVLMRYKRAGKFVRSSVCVSTQAGCAMGCTFCATGQMGLARNLNTAEIMSQILHFVRILGEQNEHLTHVTFMGMGEPLANYDETLKAIRLISHPRALGLSQRSVTLSTVGLVANIDRLASENLQINLAISLHSPDNELRKRLVPTAAPSSVETLIDAAARYRAKTSRRVTFQYALIEGVNDSVELASQLAARLKGSDAHVNIIPINPTAGDFQRPSQQQISRFQSALRSRGVNATVRSEKGLEIVAACGQLRTHAGVGSGPGVRRAGDPLLATHRP